MPSHLSDVMTLPKVLLQHHYSVHFLTGVLVSVSVSIHICLCVYYCTGNFIWVHNSQLNMLILLFFNRSLQLKLRFSGCELG